MKLIRLAQSSLRTRFIIGMSVMLLPVVLLAAGVIFSLQTTTASLDKVVEAVGEEMDTVSHLQPAHGDLRLKPDEAHAVRRRTIFVIAVIFTIGMGISIAAGTALARSILHPVRQLGESALRLGKGDYSSRAAESPDELGKLAGVFNAMAEKLEKSRSDLQDLSVRDGLTGLYNHRVFNAMLADEIVRAQRFKRPVSLLMLDIDQFKRVNDSHGHPVGDAILKGLSEQLGRQVRATDRVCRYGGEAFTVILPETDLEAAAQVAERLRAAVEAQPFDVNTGASMRITVSIGVAAFPKDGVSAPELLASADQLLFVAKRAGCNRACTSQPDPERKTRSH
jgi:diguanylate cyclase (GGDEF)-like protein